LRLLRLLVKARSRRLAGLLAVLLYVMLGGCQRFREEPPSTTWFLQLQEIDLKDVRQQSVDIVVIDPSKRGDGDSAGFWSLQELQEVQRSGKMVLAYLSVGEAEDYRDYWKKSWSQDPPNFLWKANAKSGYPDNYLVKYWDEEWHEIVLERTRRLVKMGFDGVYLDKIDAFEDWQDADSNMDVELLELEMVKLVESVGAAGRDEAHGRPFSLFVQNGWSLWSHSNMSEIIDGVGVEEYSLGWEGEDGRSTPQDVRTEMERAVNLGKAHNWKVLVIDYPGQDASSSERLAAETSARRLGALSAQLPRALDGPLR
jgi:cysteinyl-tRNA synthetase, unknown class